MIKAKSRKICDRKGGDAYMIGTVSGLKLVEVTELKSVEEPWLLPASASEAETWDLSTKGVRCFMFQDDAGTLLENLLKTVELFEPIIVGPGVGDNAAAANVDFLSAYAHLDMEKVSSPLSTPPASEVKSGDFFGVIRLDGLDPMVSDLPNIAPLVTLTH